jgi:hypothetical protein
MLECIWMSSLVMVSVTALELFSRSRKLSERAVSPKHRDRLLRAYRIGFGVIGSAALLLDDPRLFVIIAMLAGSLCSGFVLVYPMKRGRRTCLREVLLGVLTFVLIAAALVLIYAWDVPIDTGAW